MLSKHYFPNCPLSCFAHLWAFIWNAILTFFSGRGSPSESSKDKVVCSAIEESFPCTQPLYHEIELVEQRESSEIQVQPEWPCGGSKWL